MIDQDAPAATRKLSLVDYAFFVLETAERPMNVGPLFVLRPPPQRGRVRFADRLYRRMLERPAGPPFNLRLQEVSLAGMPALVPDADFDLARHVHRITLRKPATIRTLLAKVCALHVRRLDRTRPLWELYVIDGLPNGQVAVYAKMHHGVVDGVGFVKIIAQWMSTSADDPEVRAMWEGVPVSTRASRAEGPLARDLDKWVRAGTGAARTAVAFARLLWQQGRNTLGAGGGSPLPFVTTPPVLKVAPSARRSFAYCVLPFDEVKALGKSRDATINDMLLTMLDIALRRYLDQAPGAAPRPLVADMPVALGGDGSQGNRIALVQLPLGASDLSPVERLDAIVARTRAVKQELHTGSAEAAMLHSILVHALPGLWEQMGWREAPMLANLVVSNPFGFPDKRFLMGAEIEVALPVSVVAPGQVLNITAVNVEDRYQIAFIAIAEGVLDVDLLAQYTQEAFATLASALGKKRRTRRTRGGTKSKQKTTQ